MAAGSSSWSLVKWERLIFVLGKNLGASSRIMGKPAYSWIRHWSYVEFYAGPGYVGSDCRDPKLVGLPGSPVRALGYAAKSGIPFRFYLFDKDPLYAQMLALRMGGDERISVNALDCSEAVDYLIKGRISLPLGLAFFDPNGQCDWPAAQRFARKYGYMDLLFNINCATIKRMVKSPVHEAWRPMEYLESMGKKYKYLFQPIGHYQFALAFCTNYQFSEARKRGFFLSDSEEGKAIAKRINYTVDELRNMDQGFLEFGDDDNGD